MVGFALSSVLGLAAGYAVLRLFLPGVKVPWLW
jgi:hypothetical protein